MKKRVGKIFGRPIVIGDKNLVKRNEVAVKDLVEGKIKLPGIPASGSSGGSGSSPIWKGSRYEYESIEKKDPDTIYMIAVPDTEGEVITQIFKGSESIQDSSLTDGEIAVVVVQEHETNLGAAFPSYRPYLMYKFAGTNREERVECIARYPTSGSRLSQENPNVLCIFQLPEDTPVEQLGINWERENYYYDCTPVAVIKYPRVTIKEQFNFQESTNGNLGFLTQNLNSGQLKYFDVSGVISFEGFLNGCSSVWSASFIDNWSLPKGTVQSLKEMFKDSGIVRNWSSIRPLNVTWEGQADAPNVDSMFENCTVDDEFFYAIKDWDLSNCSLDKTFKVTASTAPPHIEDLKPWTFKRSSGIKLKDLLISVSYYNGNVNTPVHYVFTDRPITFINDGDDLNWDPTEELSMWSISGTGTVDYSNWDLSQINCINHLIPRYGNANFGIQHFEECVMSNAYVIPQGEISGIIAPRDTKTFTIELFRNTYALQEGIIDFYVRAFKGKEYVQTISYPNVRSATISDETRAIAASKNINLASYSVSLPK